MGSNMLLKLSSQKEIGLKIRIVHILMLAFPSMLPYLQEQSNPSQCKILLFAMINSSSRSGNKINEHIYASSNSKCNSSKELKNKRRNKTKCSRVNFTISLRTQSRNNKNH